MRYIRFTHNQTIAHGILEDDNRVALLSADPFQNPEGVQAGFALKTGETVAFDEASLLAPVVPGKILCIGLNYTDHIKEMSLETPAAPVVFMKPITTLLANGQPIEYPSISERVDYEGELAVIIGRRGKHIKKEEALSYVAGYCCANDVSARDFQPPTGQWTIGKGFDTFLPLGPWLETDADPDQLPIETRLNGEVRQKSNTSYLLFKTADLIAYISKAITLCPGDAIITGTPSGIGPMQPGDEVCVEIKGIGTLKNTVVKEALR